ncbi:MAG: hypothetical protein JSW51_07900 [Gemmatimonadota bacterium]|nr:MAG: hypothetical protein JSW51_07900 [Gemmatimonadota bacterium]
MRARFDVPNVDGAAVRWTSSGYRQSQQVRVSTAVRGILGTATVVLLLVALLVRDDPRWFVLSGTCGMLWWGWDLLMEHVVTPVGDWLMSVITGGALDSPPPGARPNLEETIEYLEGHLERGASPRVEMNAAIRLEEIYRTVKQDPERARRVVDTILERYPDAPKLKRLRQARESEIV